MAATFLGAALCVHAATGRLAAPLIFSGDMAKLDAFTLNVLCNAEVIAVDQDPLGQQAKILRQTREDFVLVKELADGSKVVGLLNLAFHPRKFP